MRKFMLANNRLTGLPPTMAAMQQLELLRLANNRLAAIPRWLHELPRLSWLALAGNPCIRPAPARAALPAVRFEDLTLSTRLGEGTSSVVREGTWRGRRVAVKLYKAPLSSDGRNLDEVRASCAVDHPNVLRWLGYVHEQPPSLEERVSGVSSAWRLVGVLEWAEGFASLGKPPSMESITRDTYDTGASFTGHQIAKIATDMANALAHLHSRGIAHGDLYAALAPRIQSGRATYIARAEPPRLS
jgi:hypothetical protein